MSKLKKIFYFAGTHWDREWYSTFQRYRFRLVKTLDKVLETLEKKSDFGCFILDGQTCAMEDYLCIRPEKRNTVKRMAEQGRLVLGPWFTMPDEWLVSGESLIANIARGTHLAKEYGGKPMRLGYVCDCFGHTPQLPQILRGFGIEGAILGRGTNDFDTPAFFRWKSPDGSTVQTFKVPEEIGYGSFCELVIWPKAKNGEKDNKQMFERAVAYVESEMKRTKAPYVVLMDGMDHERIHAEEAPVIAEYLQKRFGCPVQFGNMEELIDELKRFDLPVKAGELNCTAKRQTIHNMLISHTLSSRIDIKLQNNQTETILEKYAAPLRAFAVRFTKADIPRTYLNEAYRYLLLNHAHDSICGCSIDEVHRDMQYRFDQAKRIGKEILEESVACLTDWENDGNGGNLCLKVFNPLPYPVNGNIEAEITLPIDFDHWFFEQVDTETLPAFELYDQDGKMIPYKLLSVRKNIFVSLPDHLGNVKRHVCKVMLNTWLPACGYTEFSVVPCAHPVRSLVSSVDDWWGAENEFIRVHVNTDGTIDIFDKRTGKKYCALHSFADTAEAGDGWFHNAPVDCGVMLSGAAEHSIERRELGPFAERFIVTTRFRLPKHLILGHGVTRSEETDVLKIVSEFTLGSDPWVEIETTIYNNICDHRLQLILPTDTGAKEYAVNHAFCFVERKAGLNVQSADWKECDKPEKSFGNIVLRRDVAGNGLAFVSAYGLHEMSADNDIRSSLRITLLRAFSRTFLTDGQEDGELQKPITLKYALVPVAGEMQYADFVRIGERLAVKPVCLTSVSEQACEFKQKSYFELKSKHCILSLLSENDEGLCVRIYNCSEYEDTAELQLCRPIAEAYVCNLYNEPQDRLNAVGNVLGVSLAAWQICTVQLRL